MSVGTIRAQVAIVGSGFGGAFSAYALTRAGIDTLLIERGSWPKRDDDDWNSRQILIDSRYRSPSALRVTQYDGAAKDVAINQVVGGNSVFYGGAALRLRPNDMQSWPLSYQQMEPFYQRAEELLEVHGRRGEDPFEPPANAALPYAPPPYTAPAQRIFDAAEKLGYRPFHLPVAVNYHNPKRSQCISCFTCDGFPCKLEAKNDAVTTALAQANSAKLRILTDTIATRLEIDPDGRVTALACLADAGQTPLRIEAETFIVAGGALQSPALLLRSGLQTRDRSDTLGRYLMRHCNAIVGYVFWRKTNPELVNHKQICISHFYEDQREQHACAVGVIQDMCMPPADAVKHLAPRGVRTMAYLLSRRIQSLLCIAEDIPQAENRIALAEARDDVGLERIEITHNYHPSDIERRDYLVKRARRVLRRAGGKIGQVRLIDSFSHAVGTVRFGHRDDQAVLDTDCRAFATKNLYVVDGSFMPTSGGVNPSLTIAANALRVADRLIQSGAVRTN